jgi:hypothetical protein
MINPFELRLGNFVSDGHYGFMKISLIDDRGWATLLPIGAVTNSPRVELTELNPIPLTEEWLTKFGFEKDKRSADYVQVYYFGENPVTNDWMISLKNTGKGFFYRNSHFSVNYVHQLQNLYFALTKEELTIKI